MADRKLVLCSALCFLASKYGKCTVKAIKNALMDFYSSSETGEAREQLLQDANALNLSERWPHIPSRRVGDSKPQRDVDDIVTVWSWLDEKLQIGHLPVYVSDNPDAMPSMRLYEGDMRGIVDLLARLEGKMETKMAAHDAALARVVQEVRTLKDQSKSSACMQQANSSQAQFIPARPNDYTASIRQTGGVNGGVTGISNRDPSCVVRSTMSTTTVNATSSTAGVEYAPVTNTNWAAESAELSDNNSVIVPSEDDQSDGAGSFREPRHALRSRLRRQARQLRDQLREQQQEEQRRQSAVEDQASANTAVSRPRRVPLMIGCSSSVGSSSVTAANKWYRKSVYYVDNVDSSVTENSMKAFIRSLSVRLVSCFAVKPRRRRRRPVNSDDDDDDNDDDGDRISRGAFRICINSDDKHLLLDERKWPAYVAICEWFFKKKKEEKSDDVATDQKKKRRIDHEGSLPVAKSSAGQSEIGHTDMDMDATILAGTPSYDDVDQSLG